MAEHQGLLPSRQTGSRPLQTRILSTDSQKPVGFMVTSRSSSGSKSKSDELCSTSNPTEDGRNLQSHVRAPSKASMSQLGNASGGPSSDQRTSQMEELLVESPMSYTLDEQMFARSVQDISSPPSQKKHFPSGRVMFKASSSPLTTKSSASDSESSNSGSIPTRTRSKVRWEQLRQHVIAAPLPASPPSATRILPTLSRPPTPKLPRFPLLGFRQVVERAREATVDDSLVFADELLHICWSTRAPDSVRQWKHGRDGTSGIVGSSLQLPFVSSTTLNSFATGSTLVQIQTSQKGFHMKRPPSTVSTGTKGSLITLLHDVILRYASRNSTHLPHENLVLSTLLKPFLPSEDNQDIDEDRCIAIEAFEVAVKTWLPASSAFTVERCIWCCKAAFVESFLRPRILGVLVSLLFPRIGPIELQNAHEFLSLVQALVATLLQTQESQDAAIIRDIILQFRSGKCGSIAGFLAAAEVDGSPVMLAGVNESEVREALVTEAVVRCFDHESLAMKRRILRELLQEFWTSLSFSESLSPLISAIRSRTVITFAHAAYLFCASTKYEHLDMQIILSVVNLRIVPEMTCLTGKRASDARASMSRLLVELLRIENIAHELLGVIYTTTGQLLQISDWKISMEETMRRFVSVASSHHLKLTLLPSRIAEGEWPTVIGILNALFRLPDKLRDNLLTLSIPFLQDRIVTDPPLPPCPELTVILDKASRTCPREFFKPLFICAASSKTLTIINQLAVIAALSVFLSDFWTRDPEMILVALVDNSAVVSPPGSHRRWMEAKLGQAMILMELIACVKAVSPINKDCSHSQDLIIDTIRFFSKLEAGLGVLLEAKERTTLLPLSMRLLYMVLYTEIRLLTQYTKRPTWMQSSIHWLLQSCVGAVIDEDEHLVVDEEISNDVVRVLDQVKDIYASAEDSLRVSHQRRSTAFLSSSTNITSRDGVDRMTVLINIFRERILLLLCLPRSVTRQALNLLVVVSSCITPDEYSLVGSFLWTHCFGCAEPQAVLSASFLIMQCVEKTPRSILELIRNDLRSAKSATKIAAIQRLNILANMRFQILSQPYLLDRNRRRPFNVARDPLPFVPTDIGSSLFVPEEDEDGDTEDLPKELRQRLADVGWLDEKRQTDQKREWIRTPLSLLPNYVLGRNTSTTERPQPSSLSPISTPTKPRSNSDASDGHLSRRSSDPTNRGVKRRVVFVPALATLFPLLVSLTLDSCVDVSYAARDSVMDLLRHEPALLIRPILDLLAGNNEEAATTAVRGLLHLNQHLPPAMAHYTFNHLTGYLKFISREVTQKDSLRCFALVGALLSNLAPHVSEMSIREIRRAKMDLFLIPTGSLWFTSAPSSPMFPNVAPHNENPSVACPSLVAVTMIRVAQNMLFLSMLKRNPQDVQVIRKNMTHLVLPSTDTPTAERLIDFIPQKLFTRRASAGPLLTTLSLMLSRSYILLVTQIFRSMSRHLSDRNELAVFIGGLNRILLTHGNDIGIVSQSLIALMVASARFRRLFTSGGTYSLFMLSVVKVYTEQEHNQRIRQVIEYAIGRFYAFHQEAFVFQTLDVVVHILLEPTCDSTWLVKGVYRMLSSLNHNNPVTGPDASGIRNVLRLHEKEALLVTTADEKPQIFLAAIRRVGSQDSQQLTINLPEEYETKSLDMDNLVRLLLTVIGHDPFIVRAQNFLSLLRWSTTALYNASKSARNVLREGIDAVGLIVLRAAAKAKLPESLTMQSMRDLTADASQEVVALVDKLHRKSKTPSDFTTMRMEYLKLALAFINAGGQLPHAATEKVLDIAKILLREAPHIGNEVADFLCQYSKASLADCPRPPSPKEANSFLEDLAPIMSAYGSTINLAGVYDTISYLISDSKLLNDATFSGLVVQKICRSSLESQETWNSEDKPSSMVSLLVKAIAFRKADIVAEIEKQTPSHKFLSGIVFKFVLLLESPGLLSVEGYDNWLRNARASAWLRILSYAMAACENLGHSRQPTSPLERRKSSEKRSSGAHNKEQILTLVTAVQIIKVIIVRAGDVISTSLPATWSRLATLIRSLVSDGDAHFAVESSFDQFAPPSPTHSFDPFLTRSPPVSPNTPSPPSKPRVIDYMLWSFLELLSRYRTPLVLQLKLLLQEKVALLDEQLHNFQSGPYHPPGSRPVSIFSKPRARLSSVHSPVSPFMSNSPSIPFHPGDMSLRPPMSESTPRKAGFERSPTASPSSAHPRIIHLGPTTPDAHRSALSREDVRMLTASTLVQTGPLVRATYHRVRLVQEYMGYDLLLPLPKEFERLLLAGSEGASMIDDSVGPGGDPSEEVGGKWTMKQVVDAIVDEMHDLEVEFCQREAWGEVLDESMVVLEPNMNESTL